MCINYSLCLDRQFCKNRRLDVQNLHCLEVSKYGVFTGSYSPVLSPNTGKYKPEKVSVLCTFHAVSRTNRGCSFYIALNGRLGIFFLNHNIYELAAS